MDDNEAERDIDGDIRPVCDVDWRVVLNRSRAADGTDEGRS